MAQVFHGNDRQAGTLQDPFVPLQDCPALQIVTIDKHATRILNRRGHQIGYFPKELADGIIEGFYLNAGCVYSAVVVEIGSFAKGRSLTARVQLLEANPETSTEQLTKYASENLTDLSIAENVSRREKAEYQPRRQASLQFRHREAVAGGNRNQDVCFRF